MPTKVLLVLVLALLLIVAPADAAARPSLGIGMFRLNGDQPTDYARLAAAADTVLIQRHWQESQNPNGWPFARAVREEATRARSAGLKVAVAFEFLSADRARVELPRDLTGTLASAPVRASYLALVSRVARETRPDVFLLAVEIDGLDAADHAQYVAYRSLFPSAVRAVRIASPGTRVAASVRYVDRDGQNCFDTGDRAMYQRYQRDFYQGSFAAVSVYPLCYLHPVFTPPTFLSDLAALDGRSLYIAETGWPAEPFELAPGFVFPASPEAQAAWVDTLRAQSWPLGTKVAGVTWVSLVDPSPAVCALFPPYLRWACSLSLLTPDRAERPSYGHMVDWHDD